MDLEYDFAESQKEQIGRRRRVWLSRAAMVACVLMVAGLARQAESADVKPAVVHGDCCLFVRDASVPANHAFKASCAYIEPFDQTILVSG